MVLVSEPRQEGEEANACDANASFSLGVFVFFFLKQRARSKSKTFSTPGLVVILVPSDVLRDTLRDRPLHRVQVPILGPGIGRLDVHWEARPLSDAVHDLVCSLHIHSSWLALLACEVSLSHLAHAIER